MAQNNDVIVIAPVARDLYEVIEVLGGASEVKSGDQLNAAELQSLRDGGCQVQNEN
jgi:hypothetical protein